LPNFPPPAKSSLVGGVCRADAGQVRRGARLPASDDMKTRVEKLEKSWPN